MKISLFFLIAVHHLSGMSASNTSRSGILYFIKAGTVEDIDEIWDNSDYADDTHPYRHLLTINKLLNDTFFRSPLVDSWDTLEVNSVELLLFNSEKEYMGGYHFEDFYSGFLDKEFLQSYLLQSHEKLVVETSLQYGPGIYIHSSSDDAKFSFMSLNIENEESPFTGNQFILSANVGINFLTKLNKSAEYVKCATVQESRFINVEKVFQCTYHCLTVKNCMYYGIFTYKNTTSDQISRACVALDKFPDNKKDECSELCTDGWQCGRKYYTLPSSEVTADIYSLDPVVIKELQSMTDNSIQYKSRIEYIDEFNCVELGSQEYIGGLKLEQGSGTFNIQVFHRSCQELVDNNLYDIKDWYMGFNSGKISKFDASTPHVFAPILARCLYFNSTDELRGYSVSIRQVTSKFVLAEYMALRAEWHIPACSQMEVMSKKDIIPDSAIEIIQFPPTLSNFTNGNVFPVPVVSLGFVDITFQNVDETWINSLEILTSVDIALTIEYYTDMNCTDQSSGSIVPVYLNDTFSKRIPGNILYREIFAGLKTANIPAFCCEILRIKVKTDGNAVDPVFTVALNLTGLFLVSGNIISSTTHIHNLFETDKVSALAWFQPNPNVAFDALRPNGNGLMFGKTMGNISITICLNKDVDIAVQSVELRGTLLSAKVAIGGEEQSGSKSDSGTVFIPFKNTAGKFVHISDIEPLNSMVSTYINMTVQIHACIIQGAPDTNLTTTYQPLPNVGPTIPANTSFSPPFLFGSSHDASITKQYNTITTIPPGHISDLSTALHPYTTTTTSLLVNNPGTSTQKHFSTTYTQVPYLVSSSTLNIFSTTMANPQVNNLVSTSYGFSKAINTLINSSVLSTLQNDLSAPSTYSNISISATPNSSKINPTLTNNPNINAVSSSVSTGNSIVTKNPSSQTPPRYTNTKETTISNGNPITTTTEGTTQPNNSSLNNQQTTESNNNDKNTNLRCICSNSTKNYTSEELEEVVKEIVKNLTVPVAETSAFKRSKMSMPDDRQSSAVIGAVGVASMVTVFGVVIAMDALHIVSALNFIKSLFIKG